MTFTYMLAYFQLPFVAHAYFPEFGGDIHMDNSEVWTINSTLGISTFIYIRTNMTD